MMSFKMDPTYAQSVKSVIINHSVLPAQHFEEDKLHKAFKSMRNLCAADLDSRKEVSSYMKNIVRIVDEIFINYEERLLSCLKTGLQLLYNLSVGDSNNQLQLWGLCREMFIRWIYFDSESTREFICGILYNITQRHQELAVEIVNQEFLVKTILNSAMKGTDFPILLIEGFWKCLGNVECVLFMSNLCKCSLTVRVSIFNMLYEFLRKNNASKHCVHWTAEKYKKTVTDIKVNSELELEDLKEVYILLKIVVVASTRDEYNLIIKSDKELLSLTLTFLENIHIEGKNSESIFSPTENMLTLRTSVENLKSNLVRLIGNLCWRNRDFQDYVRINSKLPLILDCCIRDGKNPFITETVIFTIRNLCEDNIENQNFIRGMSSITHQEMSQRSQNWQSVFVPA